MITTYFKATGTFTGPFDPPGFAPTNGRLEFEGMDRSELEKLVVTLEEEMFAAAEELRFEYAAKLRDEIKEIRRDLNALAEVAS